MGAHGAPEDRAPGDAQPLLLDKKFLRCHFERFLPQQLELFLALLLEAGYGKAMPF